MAGGCQENGLPVGIEEGMHDFSVPLHAVDQNHPVNWVCILNHFTKQQNFGLVQNESICRR